MKKAKVLSVLFFLFFSFFLAPAVQAETFREIPTSRAQVQFSYAPIVKSAAPAVVNIYTRKVVKERAFSPFMDDPFFQHFFGGGLPQGMTRERLENALGSGVIVRPEGLIVTSRHVIAGADEITVVLADRREFEASVVTADERSDLAVLRIKTKGEALPFVPLKDSDEAEVGDIVLAIGNPFGVGQTVTSGIVSATARTGLDINDLNYFIQTDAAINPGNSGGALVTMDGKLVGINTAIFSKSGGHMGLGFAVPSNMVRAILAGVESGGRKIARPWTGIEGQEVTQEVASSLGLEKPTGFLVNKLHGASPAVKAGLKVGDVIVGVGGRPVEDSAAFAYRVATMTPGTQTEVEVFRSGQKIRIILPLIAPPEVPAREETLIEGRNPLSGAKIANLSPAVAEEYGLRDAERGVVIVSVRPGSPAARLGLDKGDRVEAVGAAKTASVKEVRAALEQPAGRGWRLVLNRGGQRLNLYVGG